MERCPSAVSYLYELSAPGPSGPGCSGSLVNSANGIAGLIGSGSLNASDMMAADENYCLRWNDFEKKYAETFRVLRDNDYFTDVTLVTDGHSVKAHRVILSACSNYFHAILKTMGPWQHPVLLLQDVKATDLMALMDFIYLGQVNVNQDSLPSFLKIAERLKIKGLCESLSPVTIPAMGMHQRKEMMMGEATTPPPNVTHGNFENLLPRSPYVQTEPIVSMTQQILTRPPLTTAPPAHQSSPKQSRPSATIRQPHHEPLMYVSPKRTKYVTMSPHILRNQLQIPKDAQGNEVEVKSEPIAILTNQEDVPSSGVSVTEFITTHESDLSLPSLTHGISAQFMFSPDPDPHSGSNGPMVSIDDRVRLEASVASSMTSSGTTVVVTPSPHNLLGATHHTSLLATSSAHHLHSHHGHHLTGGQQQQQPMDEGQPGTPIDEPQDLTPTQESQVTHTPPMSIGSNHSQSNHHHVGGPPTPVTPTGHTHQSSHQQQQQQQQQLHHQQQLVQTPNSLNNSMANHSNSSMSSSLAMVSPSTTPTPPKKDRNTRKSCAYCNKDFHEMSLKRHIKDMHFRSQNTYVICPQCGKQYASQNSLYSHLNRVHGYKKDMMSDLQIQVAGGTPSGSGASNGGGADGTDSGLHHQHHQHDSRDAIMDLAHHSSDNSN